jgi:glycosyltransferase involved in cell wall biosynthesis
MNHLISVIIPCYNQEKYINEALESVLKQTYSNWECIIIDDGSTDNSSEIIRNFILNDCRFKYIYKTNEGVSKARNFGIECSNGSFIQFLDADDILDKRKLEYSINEIMKIGNESVKIVITNFQMISADSQNILPPFCILKNEYFSVDSFLTQWNILFSIQMQCGFFNTALFDQIRFPENLSAQEDWVVWVLLFKYNDNFVFLDIPLVFYRMNPESRMSTIGIDDNQIKVLNVFKEILTYDEFFKLSFVLINKYYRENNEFRSSIKLIKSTNIYSISFTFKRIAKKLSGFKKMNKLARGIKLRFK